MNDNHPWEKIRELSDRDIQSLLRELDADVLALALMNVDTELENAVFRNMSEKAETALRDIRKKAEGASAEIINEARDSVLKMMKELSLY